MVGKVLQGGFEYKKTKDNAQDRMNKIGADAGKFKILLARLTMNNGNLHNCIKAVDDVVATCVHNINSEIYDEIV